MSRSTANYLARKFARRFEDFLNHGSGLDELLKIAEECAKEVKGEINIKFGRYVKMKGK